METFSLSLCHPVAFVPPGKREEEELAGSLCPPRVAALRPPGLSGDRCVPRALAQAPVVALSPWGGAWREAGDWAGIHLVSAGPGCCVVSYPPAWPGAVCTVVTEFTACLDDTRGPLPQVKQVLVSSLVLEAPFVQVQVNWLLYDFCNQKCSRKVSLYVVTMGQSSL